MTRSHHKPRPRALTADEKVRMAQLFDVEPHQLHEVDAEIEGRKRIDLFAWLVARRQRLVDALLAGDRGRGALGAFDRAVGTASLDGLGLMRKRHEVSWSTGKRAPVLARLYDDAVRVLAFNLDPAAHPRDLPGARARRGRRRMPVIGSDAASALAMWCGTARALRKTQAQALAIFTADTADDAVGVARTDGLKKGALVAVARLAGVGTRTVEDALKTTRTQK